MKVHGAPVPQGQWCGVQELRRGQGEHWRGDRRRNEGDVVVVVVVVVVGCRRGGGVAGRCCRCWSGQHQHEMSARRSARLDSACGWPARSAAAAVSAACAGDMSSRRDRPTSLGWAKLTSTCWPSTVARRVWAAAAAAAELAKVTNPKPRDLPLARSRISSQPTTSPKRTKWRPRSSSVADWGSPPTKMRRMAPGGSAERLGGARGAAAASAAVLGPSARAGSRN
mmetsp:Transcript_237/g.713  ORF Transcript_237/g.713 Transcript_237/m.713 type:complete len:225 (+) Transcript_237:101-775(+)